MAGLLGTAFISDNNKAQNAQKHPYCLWAYKINCDDLT